MENRDRLPIIWVDASESRSQDLPWAATDADPKDGDARNEEVCSYNDLSYSTLVTVITSLVVSKIGMALA